MTKTIQKRKLLCIICGKSSKDKFCENCFSKRNELFNVKNLKLNFCENCNSYFEKNKEQDINELIKKNIKSNNKIKKIKIKKNKIGNKIIVNIICIGYIINSLEKVENKNFYIFLKKRKCDKCSKMSGGYYEAVIQIRNNLAMNKIKTNSNSFIEKVKNGYNIKFLHKKDAEIVAKNLKKYFRIVKTFKLAASKKGRMLYRNYFSVK